MKHGLQIAGDVRVKHARSWGFFAHDPLISRLTHAGILRILGWRYVMVRIQFSSHDDLVKGNYLLATKTIVRRLRGQVFEIAERDLKLLDEHQLHYTILPIPDPCGSDQEVRNPLTVEL